MWYYLFTYLILFILVSVNAVASPIPLSLQKTQPKLWDIRHNIFSQTDKIGSWRQKLTFNSNAKVFTLSNYSKRDKNLGSQQIEEFLTAKSHSTLQPLSYNYVLKINNKITKTISARFYKKWKTNILKTKRKKFTKKSKVSKIKNTNQLLVKLSVSYYKLGKTKKISFKKILPSTTFLSSFLSLILSQKMSNYLSKKNIVNQNNNLLFGPILQMPFSFISFSEETFKLEPGSAKLISQNNNQFTWQSQYKNYSFNTTVDNKGKLIKSSMPLRQLRSQIIYL
ncbi:MAG: hypothetical protein HAW60_06000 [Bdellovibrionales bacterium]|nr:hypothetical protein [Bdellovibrionales bacterium]